MWRVLGRIAPDTLGGRIILVLLSGLLAFYLGSLWLHQVDIESLLGTAREGQLAERLLATKRVLEVLEPVARDRTTHDLASASLDLHWTAAPTVRRHPQRRKMVYVEHLRRLRIFRPVR